MLPGTDRLGTSCCDDDKGRKHQHGRSAPLLHIPLPCNSPQGYYQSEARLKGRYGAFRRRSVHFTGHFFSNFPIASKQFPGNSTETGQKVIEDKKIESPMEDLNREELKQMMIKAIDDLPEIERLVIALYYYEELTLKEIGQVLNLTESRISQIHSKVIIKLRTKLKSYYTG